MDRVSPPFGFGAHASALGALRRTYSVRATRTSAGTVMGLGDLADLIHERHREANGGHHWFHLWFETDPPTQILTPVRPLPARLRLDETFETWIPVADVPTVDDLERMVRVQLSNGKVVKSRLNNGSPPTGYIAGPGSS